MLDHFKKKYWGSLRLEGQLERLPGQRLKRKKRTNAGAASGKDQPRPLYPWPERLAQLKDYSYSNVPVLNKHYALARDVVRRGVAGDLVECGVCNGGSAAAAAAAFIGSGRRCWLYDSFQGLPETGERDGDAAKQYIGKCVGSRTKVEEAMGIAGFPLADCVFRIGWFEDTFVDPLPQPIAFLHIDADWYNSVTMALDTFYDRVSEGGVILLDDFGHWEGCRLAFFDFVKRRNIAPLLERFGHTQAFWVKGREHNRDFRGSWEMPPRTVAI